MKITWFKRAIGISSQYKDHISQDNLLAAKQVVLRIKSAVSLLNEQSGIERFGRVPNTRELVIGKVPYILPYRVRDNKIEILRVLHTSKRWPVRL